MPLQTRNFEDVLQEELEDPEFREFWERTALARAVANQIIQYRLNHQLSQRELARRLGVSQPVVARLELGEHEIKMSTLLRLAHVLGLRVRVDIHPKGEPGLTTSAEDAPLERLASQGIEFRVRASLP